MRIILKILEILTNIIAAILGLLLFIIGFIIGMMLAYAGAMIVSFFVPLLFWPVFIIGIIAAILGLFFPE